MKEFKNEQQFKSFLKQESERLGISIQNVYNTYIARTVLHRINDKKQDILVKGSSAEIAYLGRLVRAITDIDIATMKSFEDTLMPIIEIYGESKLDIFNLKLSKGIAQSKTGIYKLSTIAEYGKMKTPIGMDLQENYNRLIDPQYIVMPKIFEGDEEFEMFVPSFEEYLAEKLCIVVESKKENVLNTRVKDFYDIYQLHGGNYDSDKLTEYFKEMLRLRGKTTIDQVSTLNLNNQFIKSHSPIWEKTKQKYDFMDQTIDLGGAVYYTRAVLREQLLKNGIEMPDPIKRR